MRFLKENGQFLDENRLFPSNSYTFVSRKCGYHLKIAKKVPKITEIWGDRLNVSRATLGDIKIGSIVLVFGLGVNFSRSFWPKNAIFSRNVVVFWTKSALLR